MLNVKQRQMNLRFLGFYGGSIDGVQGNGTISAIEEFQKNYGLVVDGIYGQKTDAKLIEVIKAEQIKLGVTADGIAGPNTVNARDNKDLSWDNIKYFKKSDFTCKCGCGLNNISLTVVKILDEIREHFGQPGIATSGCRCASHNAKQKGSSPNSRHISGKAIDFYIKNVNKYTVLTYTKQLVKEGKLRYTYTNNANMGGSVHIDIL